MLEILEKHTGKPVKLKPQQGRQKEPVSSLDMQFFDKEQWLIQKLGKYGMSIDEGVTDRDIRRERMREAIAQIGPQTSAGKGKDGEPLSYSDLFERLYKTSYSSSSTSDIEELESRDSEAIR
jgi:hypothetical protein